MFNVPAEIVHCHFLGGNLLASQCSVFTTLNSIFSRKTGKRATTTPKKVRQRQPLNQNHSYIRFVKFYNLRLFSVFKTEYIREIEKDWDFFLLRNTRTSTRCLSSSVCCVFSRVYMVWQKRNKFSFPSFMLYTMQDRIAREEIFPL